MDAEGRESPVGADRRDDDEALQDAAFRAVFIMCVVGEGRIDAPAEDAAECHDRQQRAGTQLQHVASGLPDEELDSYKELMAQGLFGRAFAALVAVGQQRGAGDGYWRALAAVAETLCLNELLGEDEPAGDDADYVRAAYVVREVSAGR